jgi:prolipoprotein diacylglyceryltransferase
VALWLWARLTKRPLAHTAALLAPGLALLVAFGWAACAVEGCGYGRAAPPGLWAGDLPDDTGVYALRYRTQLGGAVGALVVFALAWWAAARLRPAALFWMTLGGLAGVHIIVALGRGDPSPVVLGLRLDLLIEVGLLAAAVVGLAVDGWRSRVNTSNE